VVPLPQQPPLGLLTSSSLPWVFVALVVWSTRVGLLALALIVIAAFVQLPKVWFKPFRVIRRFLISEVAHSHQGTGQREMLCVQHQHSPRVRE